MERLSIKTEPLQDVIPAHKLIEQYLNRSLSHKEIINDYPSKEAFIEKAAQRASEFKKAHREVLVSALKKQNKFVELSASSQQNIELLLDSDTVTIVTGHQLNIFSGPLYSLYKIAHAIKVAKQLEVDAGRKVVPIFWMATEDHDFEEIASFKVFGKSYSWEEESRSRAVGRISNASISGLMEEVESLFENDEKGKDLFTVFIEAYKKDNLSNAVRHYMNALFGAYGLVIVDGDDQHLKQLFFPVVQAEIESKVGFEYVRKSIKDYFDSYKVQVNPRALNLFYIEDDVRYRLDFEGDSVVAVGTQKKWSKESFLEMAQHSPEAISPNVILRPIYQEYILPNVAYIGGAGEISYWLELKQAFEAFNISFPIPMVRNSVLLLDAKSKEKLTQFSLTVADLFEPIESLASRFIKAQVAEIELGEEKVMLKEMIQALNNRFETIDKGLLSSLKGEEAKLFKSLENLEKKANKAVKNQNSKLIKQLERLRDKVLPSGTLQERKENVLSYYSRLPEDWLTQIIEEMPAYESSFLEVIY